MKRLFPVLALTFLFHLPDSAAQSNDAEAAKNWSLFFEYHKNGDYVTAAPYGWKVIQLAPARFKTVYGKLAECYYNFYQKADSSRRSAFADTVVIIYDLGIEKVPDRSASLWLSRGYAISNYFEGRDSAAIKSYEKALELDPATDFVYVDQLGMLYIKNHDKDPSLKAKGVALYQKVLDTPPGKIDQISVGMTMADVQKAIGEPDGKKEGLLENEKVHEWTYATDRGVVYFANGKVVKVAYPQKETAAERLRLLVSDPRELIDIAENQLKRDPNNLEKIWNAAQAYVDAEQFDGAEKYLLRLVKMSPKTATYWNELAKVRQRLEKYRQAIDSYEEALKLNPALRENYLNITICYRMMKNYGAARSTALKAAQREKGWGRPYMEIGEVYKAAVEVCVKDTKGGDWAKLDIDDKLVYKLAQEYYARAKSVDPSLGNEVNQRINELSTLVPTREDLFFNRDRIVNGKMRIAGPCYGWVDEQVAVELR